MPKDGSHKGYSLFPSVCSDSCFVEIFDSQRISKQKKKYQSKKLVTQTTFQNKEKDEVLLSFGYGIRIWACIGRKIEITSV